MKRHVWIEKGSHIDTIELIIKDSSMKKLESWVIHVHDKKRARQIMRTLKESYGIDFGIDKDKDLSWLD